MKFNQLYSLLKEEDTEDDLLSKGLDTYDLLNNTFIGAAVYGDDDEKTNIFCIDIATNIFNFLRVNTFIESIWIKNEQSQELQPVNQNELLNYITQMVSQNKVAIFDISDGEDRGYYYAGNNVEQMFLVAKKQEKFKMGVLMEHFLSYTQHIDNSPKLKGVILNNGRLEKFSQDELDMLIYIKTYDKGVPDRFTPIVRPFKEMPIYRTHYNMLDAIVNVVKNKKAIMVKGYKDISFLIKPAADHEF